MSKNLLRTGKAWLALLFFFACLDVAAQVTTSSVTGVVSDKGNTLPGASVVATHIPSGTVYGTSTNTSGRFTIPNMRVGGPYAIEITYVGYRPYKMEGAWLQLGEPLVIDAVMQEESSELAEVIVSAEAISLLDGDRTGASTNVDNRTMNALPTINRTITDFTRLTPQANGNSFAGRDGRYNNLQIDGANFNNAFGLSNNVLPGGRSQPISLDAIEEIQVNIAPYDVRQSGFTGAGINAVTRSGTNSFTGSAYTFYRNQRFNGLRVGDLELEEADESTTQTFGLRLGGPIVKNKLFFFVNAERQVETGANAGATNLWKASENGVANPQNNIARPSRADLDAVRNHLINQWGYDPGRYEGYANEAEAASTSFLARIDWNISPKHKLAVRYNQVVGSSPSLTNASSGPYPRSTSVARVSDQSIAFEKATYATENSVRSVTLELNSNINTKLSNQFLATYSRIQDRRTSPSEVFPFVDIGDGTGSTTPGSESYVNYMSFGYELFSYKNDLINNNYSFTNNLTYLAGDHTFTAGAAFDVQKFGNSYLRSGTSYYRYATVADFLTTGTPGEVAPIMFSLNYPYEGQDPYARTNFGQFSLYVQDRWTVNSKLDLTLGVRAELPLYLNDLTPNASIDALQLRDVGGSAKYYKSGEWPKSRLMVSPRVGFNYDVYDNRSLVVRGGTGVFTGRVPFVWLSNMPTNSGVIQNLVEPGSYASIAGWIGDIRFDPDPYHWLNNTPASATNVFIKTPNAGFPGGFALVDNDFKMPSIWRTSIGADYTIPGTPLIATADIMYTRDINAVFQFGANRADATMTLSDAGGDNRAFWPTAASATSNNNLGANQGVVLANTKTKGNAISATAGVTLPQQNGFFGSLFYTYTAANEVTGNPGSSASSAWGGSPSINSPNDQILFPSAYGVPHRIVANLSYRFEYGRHFASTVSLFFNGSHQGRFSYVYSGTVNGGGGFSGLLLYVPNSAADLNWAANGAFTVEQQMAAFDAYLSNDKFLDKSRGGYADRNGALMPWLNRFDLRILQDIFTDIGERRNTVQVSVDVFNFGNMLNPHWGVQQALNGAQNLLRVQGVTAQGVPTFQMNTIQVEGQTVLPTAPFRDVTTTGTTWAVQLGVRYIF